MVPTGRWQQESDEAILKRLLVASMTAVIIWTLQRDSGEESIRFQNGSYPVSGRTFRIFWFSWAKKAWSEVDRPAVERCFRDYSCFFDWQQCLPKSNPILPNCRLISKLLKKSAQISSNDCVENYAYNKMERSIEVEGDRQPDIGFSRRTQFVADRGNFFAVIANPVFCVILGSKLRSKKY